MPPWARLLHSRWRSIGGAPAYASTEAKLTLRMMASASFLQAARSRVRVLTMMESVSP